VDIKDVVCKVVSWIVLSGGRRVQCRVLVNTNEPSDSGKMFICYSNILSN